MGKGIREFKSSVSGDDRDDDEVPVRRSQELPLGRAAGAGRARHHAQRVHQHAALAPGELGS